MVSFLSCKRCSCGGTNFRQVASPDEWHEQVRPVFHFILGTILARTKKKMSFTAGLEILMWLFSKFDHEHCSSESLKNDTEMFAEDFLLTLVTVSICTTEISCPLNVHTPIQPIDNNQDHLRAGHDLMPTRTSPTGTSHYHTVDSLHTKEIIEIKKIKQK